MIDDLPGIDGRNPLGFLAALGVLTAVGGRLSWKPAGSGGSAGWTPVITRDGDDRPLIALVNEVLGIVPPSSPKPTRRGRPAIAAAPAKNHVPFGYKLAPDSEQPCDDFKGDGEKVTAKCRFATAETLRKALRDPCTIADVERIVSHAAITVVSKNGGPGTSMVRSLVAGGQVRYLRTLREIIETATQADIAEAIVGPWRYRKASKTSMDPNSHIENVGQEIAELGAISVLGAERLAVEGLRSLPTAPRGRFLVTRGFLRRSFRWCLWQEPLSLGAVRMLMGAQGLYAEPEDISGWALSIGVSAVFACDKFQHNKHFARLRRTQTLFESA